MRNFDLPMENLEKLNRSKQQGVSEGQEIQDKDSESGFGTSMEELETTSPQVFGNLSPEALNYIQRLQSELSNAKEVSKLSENSVISSFCSLNKLLNYRNKG